MKKIQSNPTPALGNCVLHCPTSCVHAVVPLSGEGVSTQQLDTARSSSSPCEGGGWEGVRIRATKAKFPKTREKALMQQLLTGKRQVTV